MTVLATAKPAKGRLSEIRMMKVIRGLRQLLARRDARIEELRREIEELKRRK